MNLNQNSMSVEPISMLVDFDYRLQEDLTLLAMPRGLFGSSPSLPALHS